MFSFNCSIKERITSLINEHATNEMKGFGFMVNVRQEYIGQQRRWLFNADEIRGQRIPVVILERVRV